MIVFRKYGDWSKAGIALQHLTANINPTFKARLEEDGELVLKTMVEHIDKQDLGWTPLSDTTIKLKGGDETIYVETGFLRNNLRVRKIKSSTRSVSIFIGASPWDRTPEGVKFSDLMIWLEYGTNKIPPRPLIRPTFLEIKPIIEEHWKDILKDLIDV